MTKMCFYTRKVGKRLISVSEESDANMISKLKETCGSEYVDKLYHMLTGACFYQIFHHLNANCPCQIFA